MKEGVKEMKKRRQWRIRRDSDNNRDENAAYEL